MCNDTSPKAYLAKRMLPLHDRVMDFLNAVEVKHHKRAMYNLYNSDASFKAAYNHEKYY